MSKKLKINSNNNIECVKDKQHKNYTECINCEHSFAVNFIDKVVWCRRGALKDKDWDVKKHF